MRELTDFSNDKNTYSFIINNATHEFTNLNVPDYDTIVNTAVVDYHNYKPAYFSKNIDVNQAYQVNVAALLQVGKWLDYLKQNEVYDNTRIIIVADHGRDLPMDEFYPAFASTKFTSKLPVSCTTSSGTVAPTKLSSKLPAANNPLFMVKDFNAKGKLKTDNSFMSNADTLFFAIIKL